MSCLLLSSILALFVINGGAAAGDIPDDADAYEAGAVVTIDAATLLSLTDSQLRALLEFAGICGRVLLVDVPEPAQQVFRNRAACGGRYLATATSQDELSTLQLRLSNLPEPARASPAQLRQLLEETAGRALVPARLGVFMAAYLLLMILLLLNSRTRVAALGFSIVAALLVHLVWPPSSVRTFVAWAESDLGERVAIYEAIERNEKFRDGSFAREDQLSRGSFAINPTLEVALQDNVISLCNAGMGVSTATHLFRRGEIIAIPPLAAGASWQVGNTPPVVAHAPELVLFRERSAPYGITLLQPLPVGDATSFGWLMLLVSEQRGRTTCDH